MSADEKAKTIERIAMFCSEAEQGVKVAAIKSGVSADEAIVGTFKVAVHLIRVICSGNEVAIMQIFDAIQAQLPTMMAEQRLADVEFFRLREAALAEGREITSAEIAASRSAVDEALKASRKKGGRNGQH